MPRFVARTSLMVLLAPLVIVLAASPVLAQTPPAGSDGDLVLAEPDYTIVSLPTSLRLPPMRGAFRLTHRFIRPLNCERCPDNLLEDLFGLDNGAYIGLEYRMGIVSNLQAGIHRARGDKTIDLYGEYGLTRQNEHMPLELAARISVEGTDNFRDEYSPTVDFIATRLFGERGALHVEPIWVGNSNLLPEEGDDSTFMIGLGGRLRIRPSVYIVGEFVPRVSGYTPGTNHGAFSLEKRAGGHVFQLTFSNDFATTLGEVARGAVNDHDWFLGFNLTRKFF